MQVHILPLRHLPPLAGLRCNLPTWNAAYVYPARDCTADEAMDNSAADMLHCRFGTALELLELPWSFICRKLRTFCFLVG